MLSSLFVFCLLAARPAAVAAPQTMPAATAQPAVTGTVHTSAGGPVSGATVTLRGGSGAPVTTTTGPDGRFSFATAPAGLLEIAVQARGFTDRTLAVRAGDTRQSLSIELTPAGVAEAVTVTATRSEATVGDVPASVTLVRQSDLRQSPAVLADDKLREVPTFSLFRRTSSLALHPTSQGVTLRGLGPSGVSRTLVLLDGVPFNDPFGGWVYWSRVPTETAERIEVVETPSSSLYGNYAMGGVINIVTPPAAPRTLQVTAQDGSLNSPKFDYRASNVWGKLGVSVEGAAFSTDGYAPVAPAERGTIDNNASVNFKNTDVKIDYAAADRLQLFARTGYLRERRNNGKVSTFDGTEEKNDTSWGTGNGGARYRFSDGSTLEATVYGDHETFHSNFLAVPAANPARSIGRMTLNQTVPTTGIGGMVQWSRTMGARQFVTVGTDWRRVKGDSDEDGLDSATGTSVTLKRVSGGRQTSEGVFVEDLVTVNPKLVLTLSARADHWRSYDAHNLETNYPSGTATANNNPALPERTDSVVSPRAAALYHLTERVSVWGDWSSAFRAPTLNELYRQFKQGSVTVLANNQLAPERLKSAEGGATVEVAHNLTWRATYFENRVRNPISNVTTVAPSAKNGNQTTQQRQNLGRTRIHGLQTDAEYRLGASWTVTGAYMYDLARVAEATIDPSLGIASTVGNLLPQVPKHRGTLQVTYSDPRYLTASVSVQATGLQFDDDQNTRVLGKYAVVGFSVARDLDRTFQVFLGGQNLFNKAYAVATLPTLLGSPRIITAGVRVNLH